MKEYFKDLGKYFVKLVIRLALYASAALPTILARDRHAGDLVFGLCLGASMILIGEVRDFIIAAKLL